ncbi:MAG: arylsulfatase [Prolixibacteraceae bacterium]|jgi:arylsulfatase A|nr:arylsulfatase [Prolixibacteraceae bacterium]MBT6006431.1 arylsulfatase [Prolixibacteraceae bacterium]MBT6763198.1 arylsulfatase [Prolixibacteraceae bacterium]MBT6997395.1 arylsulfatase [Prolixibacteraceae bacterium]MBT7396606.1 arylsulfatase [Prolixibacteraceae bacterium]
MKKKYIIPFAVIFANIFFSSCEDKKFVKPDRPNIVYLLADDMGIGDLGCYNPESKIPTPAMDALAKDGMMFTDAHTNSAVCTPTRYGILTGTYAFRTRLKSGVLWGSSPTLINKGEATVASLLRKNGYNTAVIGKWHLGLNWQTLEPNVELTDNWQQDNSKIDYSKPILFGPNSVGFDYFFGIPASLDMPPYLYVENQFPQGIPTEITNEGGRTGLTVPGFKAKNVMPDFTEKAVDFINQQKPGKPFFLYFPWAAPHTPVVPNDEFIGKSKAGEYGDFVVECDATVKKIVQALKEKGLYENTIIILTSDNGCSPHGFPIQQEIEFEHNTSNGFKGRKSHSYEGGHRVPFIVSWPKQVEANSVSNEIICTTDLYATVANLLGHEMTLNEAHDSYSFLPILKNEGYKKPLREATIHHSLNGDFSIRKGDWKYIDAKGHGGFGQIKEEIPEDSIQLYNLANDFAETTNVYLKNQDVVEELKTLLEEYKTKGFSRGSNIE